MGKPTKNQLLRERMAVSVMRSKQTTFDGLPEVPQSESSSEVDSKNKKKIIITEIETATKEDELVLTVGFRLLPSKVAFSKVTSDLYFNTQKLNSACISIPQGPLSSDEFQYTPVLGMRGISAGSYLIRVDMYELWSSGEKLTCTSKEITVAYTPQRREDRLIKIPIVKSITGGGLALILNSDKNIYREIEDDRKKEIVGKRDAW